MNIPTVLQLTIASIAIFVAAVNHRVSQAPGWRDQRWFSYIALATGAYALAGLPAELAPHPDGVLLSSRLQLALALVQVAAWCRYADALLDCRRHAVFRAARAGLALLALASLVPGVSYARAPRAVLADAAGQVPLADPTPFGLAVLVFGIVAAASVVLRFVGAWRRGVRVAGLHALALGIALLLGLNDALVTSGVFTAPFLLDLGLVLPLATVTWALTERIASDARAVHGLRERLDRLVDERTRDLARTQEALVLSERLASLGHFAAGVAHEVNNPASVVSANLRYLADHLDGGTPPPDASDSLRDALDSMTRINDLVRRLVDAGRLAGAPRRPASTSVAESVRQALAEARARAGDRVRFQESVPGDLHVDAKREVLQQVLGHLLANAAEAVPEGRGGRVEVRAERAPAGVRIVVEDDGVGMPPEVLQRVFEPFFSTRPPGRGSGLGLPISRSLAESHGGDLRLESEPGKGTRALLDLPEAAPQA
jgi:signal transduction histidine kinase